jgi:hypothetical protein
LATAAGGVTDTKKMPLDGVKDSGGKYFKFYIPGVGTLFPEVNDRTIPPWVWWVQLRVRSGLTGAAADY